MAIRLWVKSLVVKCSWLAAAAQRAAALMPQSLLTSGTTQKPKYGVLKFQNGPGGQDGAESECNLWTSEGVAATSQ